MSIEYNNLQRRKGIELTIPTRSLGEYVPWSHSPGSLPWNPLSRNASWNSCTRSTFPLWYLCKGINQEQHYEEGSTAHTSHECHILDFELPHNRLSLKVNKTRQWEGSIINGKPVESNIFRIVPLASATFRLTRYENPSELCSRTHPDSRCSSTLCTSLICLFRNI